MANRKNTFLIKRSNVAGKVPTAGDLQLGELAINTSDVILYASGTTANSILPIGWDRVARTGDTMTGSLFTPYLSATTISATSINKVDYIVFNTGTTSATTQAGTVYFDNTEHALSYNTSINQGVTVNMGQQNYLRVFNNSGTDIQRGKALEVLSAYSGLPSVTLAINKHTGFNIVGVSAEIIPNNSEGIAITNGIISNIELTGMTVGSLIYASDTVAGKLDDATKYLSFPLTARTNQIGFVVATGVTTGKLFVNIQNENSALSLTDLERNVLEGNTLSTGLFEFTGMTTASTTTFNIAPLQGWIIKNTYEYATLPDVQGINYTGGTNISVTNLASADSTYILITSALTVTQQVTFPTPQERRENIFLGKVNHPNRTSILNINNTADYDVSPMSALRDLWSPIRLINQGIIPSPNGSNLSFNTSAGILWGNGINWHNNQLSPNNVSIAAKVPASFFYRTQTGGTSGSVTVINPRNYDVGGVITSITPAGSNDATNQRIYMYPTGVINVLYGQTRYATLAEAIANIQSETFIPYPNVESTGILIGVLSVRNDIVADGEPLTNTDYAKFTLVSKFGESFGGTGGLSTTTLQQAYDNSTNPEIVINSILGGLSIQNGTGNADNVTRLLEGQSTANGVTSFIRADGYISGTTFQSNSFIANNGGATATTFNILTLGSGTPLTNLGVDVNGRVVSGTTGGSTFTGGTVTGPTSFTNGLTANTISATTIQTPSFRANNGGITATTVSATTYFNLPIDVYSTGGTYNGSNLYITNNTGGTFTVTGLTASGFSANYYGSFSDTTNQPVSGSNIASVWTYNTTELSNGVSVVNGSQIKVANKGVYEIGYSAQIEKTLSSSADVTIWAAINGVPVTRSSSIISLVANSVIQLPFVSFIFELNTNDYVEFYFSSPSEYVQLSSYSGLTTPTRPVAPSVIIVAKQVGLSVTDNLSGNYLPLSGGTVTGGTVFNNGLTATTVSATTYQNLPLDIRVTGATYSNNTFTYTNNTGGTFSTLFNTMTGLTISGNLTVSGGTQSIFSGNSSLDLVRITQTGSGNAFVVEDSVNPDTSSFSISNAGDVGIGIAPEINFKLQAKGTGTIAAIYGIGGTAGVQGTGTQYGVYGTVDGNLLKGVFGHNLYGIGENAIGVVGSAINGVGVSGVGGVYGGRFSVDNQNGSPIGVYATVSGGENGGTGAYIAGKFDASGGEQNYALQLLDSTQGINKVLVSQTSDGKANWSSTLSGLTGVYTNTISATTYSNLPIDIRVTGGTYSSGTATFTNNTGGTFTVTGFSTGGGSEFTGGTVTGPTVFTGGLTANTISATTINTTNLYVTGGTQSIFSGNSSSELIKIIQSGSGDAFVVQDQANGDASHFVINASGNTAIGLTAPIGNDKLTVSGNTTIYGTLSATTYVGLPNSGVLVVPIATSSVSIGTGSNDYYLNFKVPYNLTISKVDFSVSIAGSDSVRIGIYRGQDLTAVLVGQSTGGTVSTLNSVPIVAESGQNLSFSGGSWIVIGVAVGGTTTNLYGSACPSNNLIAWTNTTDSAGGFPANPRSKGGTRTSFPSIELTLA